MLGKLIKYDFKAMSRIMLPIFLAMLALSLIDSLLFKFRLDNYSIATIFYILTFFVFIGSGFLTLLFVSQRFEKSLLKNEAYLNFALPASTIEHIVAKVINLIIWSFLNVIVLTICFVIVVFITGGISDLIEVFKALFRIDLEDMTYILRYLTFLTLSYVSVGLLVYASYAVGHLFKKHQTAMGIGFFVLFTIISSYINQSSNYGFGGGGGGGCDGGGGATGGW